MPDSRPEGAIGARAEQAGPVNKGEPDPLIGRVVSGRFKILSVIARGGMGKVHKAEQAPLGRICALKVLSPKYEGDRDPEFHKRFLLEASTAAKLTHANTVTIFDYGQDGDDLYFIAMEYIEGRTLHRVLRDEGPFPSSASPTSPGRFAAPSARPTPTASFTAISSPATSSSPIAATSRTTSRSSTSASSKTSPARPRI